MSNTNYSNKILDHVRQLRETRGSNESFEIERLLPPEEQGRIYGGRRHVEATLIAGTVHSAGAGAPGGSAEKQSGKEAQVNALEFYARQEGIYIEDPEQTFGGPLAGGSEQTVYAFPPDPSKIVKVNDMSFHPDPLGFLDRIAMHNAIFPETGYELIGFSVRYGTKFAAVLTQPIVVGRASTREEVEQEMHLRGFEHIGGCDYFNSNYIVEDLHGANVLVSPRGNLLFIDPVLYLNEEEDDLGGKRLANDAFISS